MKTPGGLVKSGVERVLTSFEKLRYTPFWDLLGLFGVEKPDPCCCCWQKDKPACMQMGYGIAKMGPVSFCFLQYNPKKSSEPQQMTGHQIQDPAQPELVKVTPCKNWLFVGLCEMPFPKDLVIADSPVHLSSPRMLSASKAA